MSVYIPSLLLNSCHEWKKFCSFHRVFIWDYINEENSSELIFDNVKIEYLLSEMEYQLFSSEQFGIFIHKIKTISKENLKRMLETPVFEKIRIHSNKEVLNFVETVQVINGRDRDVINMLSSIREKLFREIPPFVNSFNFKDRGEIMSLIDDSFLNSSKQKTLSFLLSNVVKEELIIFSLDYYLKRSPNFERITEIIVCMEDKDFTLIFIYLKWLLKNDSTSSRYNVLYLMEAGIDEEIFNYLKEISF